MVPLKDRPLNVALAPSYRILAESAPELMGKNKLLAAEEALCGVKGEIDPSELSEDQLQGLAERVDSRGIEDLSLELERCRGLVRSIDKDFKNRPNDSSKMDKLVERINSIKAAVLYNQRKQKGCDWLKVWFVASLMSKVYLPPALATELNQDAAIVLQRTTEAAPPDKNIAQLPSACVNPPKRVMVRVFGCGLLARGRMLDWDREVLQAISALSACAQQQLHSQSSVSLQHGLITQGLFCCVFGAVVCCVWC
jgi:hypothetical protein